MTASLRSLLLASHGVVLLLPVAALLISGALGRDLLEQRRQELIHLRVMLQRTLAPLPDDDFAATAARMQPALAAIHAESLAGVRLLDADGVVIASSGPGLGADLSDRPEVRHALAGSGTELLRKGAPALEGTAPDGSGRRWLFSAGPVVREGEVVGAVLLTRRTRETGEALRDLSVNMPRGLLFSSLLTALLALSIAGYVARSMRRLSQSAERIASGSPEDAALTALTGSRLREVSALAAAVSRMNRRLQARLRHNMDYASNISHEFKNPLTTLRGTVDLLQTDTDMPPAQRQRFLANAAADLDRMVEMVSGLLLLARIEVDHRQERVDLAELAEEVCARFAGVTAEGAGAVQGDAVQLEIAVGNLVDNAVRHGALPIRIAITEEGGQVCITVEDAGDGVPEALADQVFERFFTTDRDRAGTGLGLALVAAIAERHGGDVALTSAPGRCAFTLRLPSPG